MKYYCFVLLLLSLNAFGQNGWIEEYSDAKYGLSVSENNSGGFSIVACENSGITEVLLLQLSEAGDETNRLSFTDHQKEYTFQENNTQTLLTEDDGILISAYNKIDTSINYISLIKYDNQGALEWSENFVSPEPFEITTLAQHQNGFVLCGNERNTKRKPFVAFADEEGNLQWVENLSDSITIEDVEVDTIGNILVLSRSTVIVNGENINFYFLNCYGSDGSLISASPIGFNYIDFQIDIEDLYISDENRIVVVGSFRNWQNSTGFTKLLLTELSSTGAIIDINGYQLGNAHYSKALSISKALDDGWVVCGTTYTFGNEHSRTSFYAKISEQGLLNWESNDNAYDYGIQLNHVITTSDNGYVYVGASDINFSGVKAIKTNAEGKIQTNVIFGSIFNDINGDCINGVGEFAFKNWVVKLTNLETGEETLKWFYNYGFDFRVDIGTYLLTTEFLDEVWSADCDSIIVEITEENTVVEIDFPLTPQFNCPLMTVDLTSPILERCEKSIYKIQVNNIGTIKAEDVYLEVELDPSIELLESSIPFAEISSGLYQFQLGDINISITKSIKLIVDVNCDSTILGQTHCATARVYPDSLCIELNPEWDGSVIDVDGECLGDSVAFEISNDGLNGMNRRLKYYVIEDDAIFRSGEFQLDQGESIVVFLPADGATYRVETDENPGYIFGGRPSHTIEGCGASLEDASLGFVNRFPLYDNSPFISIDCQENIMDLEGNLHIAYPEGYDDEHFIRKGDELEYFIRFENTFGTTIQNVTIIDTLDEDLNIETLSIGVTSHPYSIDLEDDNVLKIHFSDINLSDEEDDLNYGFLKFKIDPKADLNLGSVIENQVTIIMDSIVMYTDLVFHTLGQELVLNIENYYRNNLEIQAYPNPFVEVSKLSFIGQPLAEWNLKVYNLNGNLIRIEQHYGNESVFRRENLTNGLYLFTIEDKNGLIGSGKLMIQD